MKVTKIVKKPARKKTKNPVTIKCFRFRPRPISHNICRNPLMKWKQKRKI